LFVNDEHELHDTFDIREEYFDSSRMRIRVYTVDCDFSEEDVQRDYLTLAAKFDDCSGCDDDWVVKGSLSSWYGDLINWVS
jgi:hypothetical protein